jgi:3-alpha domain/Oxidoreductase FAD-binding domain
VTVAEINALLYLPGHPASGLERALRIPALSAGWRASLEALLDRERKGGGTTGNPGLGLPQSPPPAWPGFRSLRVSRKLRESSNVTSLVLESADGEPLSAALAGQFIVLRLRPRLDESALLRSYSLSGATTEDRYRISIKREPQGAAGAYIDTRVRAGDLLDVSAPLGSFTLRRASRRPC